MAKEIAVISPAAIGPLLACLSELGFTFPNLLSGEIYGYPSDGSDRRVLPDPAAAIDFLHEGGTLQFWKDESEDLALSYLPESKTLRLYFDGYSAMETTCILEGLKQYGIEFEIDFD